MRPIMKFQKDRKRNEMFHCNRYNIQYCTKWGKNENVSLILGWRSRCLIDCLMKYSA